MELLPFVVKLYIFKSDCNSAVYASAFEIFSHRVRIMIQLAIF